MNYSITKKKNVIANENGYILCNYIGNNTASFFANLPKSAVVDHIRVDGVFLEDINTKKIKYHKELIEGEYKVVATVEFEDYDLETLYDKLANYIVQDFEVYYHLESVIEE